MGAKIRFFFDLENCCFLGVVWCLFWVWVWGIVWVLVTIILVNEKKCVILHFIYGFIHYLILCSFGHGDNSKLY